MTKKLHQNLNQANADPVLADAGLAGARPRSSAGLNRFGIYALCTGVFCLGLFTLGVTFGENRFVATATVHAAGAEPQSRSGLPLMAKLPDAVLRRVIETEGLANDPEFVPRDLNWMTRIALVFGWTDVASHVQASREHVLTALEQTITVKAATQADRLGLNGFGMSDGDAPQPSFARDFQIEVSSYEGNKAARLANALAQALVDQHESGANEKEAYRGRMAADAESFASRLQFAKQNLADFQSSQDQRDSATLGKPQADGRMPTLAEAKADVQTITRAMASGAVSVAALHFQTPELDRLLSDYAALNEKFQKRQLILGDKHPELVALENQLGALKADLRRQWAKAASVADSNYRMAQSHVPLSGRTLAAGDDQSAASSFELARLKSDVDVARHDYEHALSLQVKADEAASSQASWSMSPAQVPASATHKPHGFIAGAALILGAMFGAGRVLTDGRRIPRNGPAPRRQNGSRIVPVPRIKRSWFADALRLKPELDVACREVLDQPRSEFSRMIEGLHDLCGRSRGMVKILFVAEHEGLGVTTLAVNFAQMAAEDGARILLIEANRTNPVMASLISPHVNADLIDLMGVERIICHLRKGLSIIPILDEETTDILRERAQYCIEGLAGNFDLVIIDGGAVDDEDDELTEMAKAVNRVFHLTQEGIELGANINSFKTKR